MTNMKRTTMKNNNSEMEESEKGNLGNVSSGKGNLNNDDAEKVTSGKGQL